MTLHNMTVHSPDGQHDMQPPMQFQTYVHPVVGIWHILSLTVVRSHGY